MTSTAGTRPLPSLRGMSRIEITAARMLASWMRIWRCWWGGKTETMRLIVSGASRVWSVLRTRWPVSAAISAGSIVSMSRISPTRMMSGSSRSALRRPREKLFTSQPTSRWQIVLFLSRWRNSIGSSMVMMCLRRLALMESMIEARVVVLPLPVVPVTRIRPRSNWATFSMTSGRHSSRMGFTSKGMIRREMAIELRWRKMLPRNRPKPGRL